MGGGVGVKSPSSKQFESLPPALPLHLNQICRDGCGLCLGFGNTLFAVPAWFNSGLRQHKFRSHNVNQPSTAAIHVFVSLRVTIPGSGLGCKFGRYKCGVAVVVLQLRCYTCRITSAALQLLRRSGHYTIVALQLSHYNSRVTVVALQLWRYNQRATIAALQLPRYNCGITIVAVHLQCYNCRVTIGTLQFVVLQPRRYICRV